MVDFRGGGCDVTSKLKLELVESRKNSILAMISVVSTNNIESLNLALEGDLGVIEIESERTSTMVEDVRMDWSSCSRRGMASDGSYQSHRKSSDTPLVEIRCDF